MKIKFLLVVVFVLNSFDSFSDPVGATDAAALKQMMIIVENTRLQLEEMRKTLSVTENLKNMKQNEFVKELTDTGQAFGSMINDIKSMERELKNWKEDPYGTRQIESDIDRLSRRLKAAEGQQGLDKGASYSNLLRSLNQLKWLGKLQSENEDKLSSGSSEKDSVELSASASVAMSRIILEREMAIKRREVINQEIFSGTIKNVDYGSLGLMEDK